MTSFVLQTDDEQHLGFVLFANHEGDWPPEGPIPCMISGLPSDAELWDDPRGKFFLDRGDREHRADFAYDDAGVRVAIALDDGWLLELRRSGDDDEWSAARGDETMSGKGLFL